MSRRLVRLALPVLGLLAVIVLVLQVRGAGAALPSAAPAPAAATTIATDTVRAEGRVVAYPGAEVEVGTDFAGTLARVAVEERDKVRKGQLLAEFVADDLAAELEEARARLMEAEADLRLAEVEIARSASLVERGAVPRQDLDRRVRDREAGEARRRTALASIGRLEAQLAKTRIVSPIDGVVIARKAEGGETLERGDLIVTVADLSRVRIEAEVDEYDAGRVALEARASIEAEGYDGQGWSGRVEEIPDAVSLRALKPQDPGRPTDTRVLLVKVALDGPTPLKLGQRVEVSIGG